MKTPTIYLVSKSIADTVRLTDIRLQTPDGRYILSAHDILSYGLENALQDGAEEMPVAEAKEKYHHLINS